MESGLLTHLKMTTEIGKAAIDRVIRRLLPFLLVAYIANSRSLKRLVRRSSDFRRIAIQRPRSWARAGMFFVGYVLFQIPGTISSSGIARVGALPR
jgi:hypothetical protein